MIMKRIIFAVAGAVAIVGGISTPDAATKTQMSQSECTKLWQQANPSGATGLTESQSSGYVANFKAVNPDGDSTIDVNEWNAACKKGLIQSTSSSGASSGDTGAANSSKRAPANEMSK
jgi:hypothetical protein